MTVACGSFELKCSEINFRWIYLFFCRGRIGQESIGSTLAARFIAATFFLFLVLVAST
jgi:hypothetical protein